MPVVRLFLVMLSVIALSACGESFSASPTAPSASVPERKIPISSQTLERGVEVPDAQFSWEIAEGCVWQKPAFPTSLIGTTPESTRMPQGRDELWAMWSDPANPNTEPVCHNMGSMSEVTTIKYYVVAIFVQQGSQWHYCQWSPMTMEQNALRSVPCEKP